MNTTDALIAALEGAIELLKEGCREDRADASLRIAAVIREGEAAIRQTRQAERDNAVLVKPQPTVMRIDGWDI